VSVAGSISGGGGGGSIEEKSDASPSSDLHVFMLARALQQMARSQVPFALNSSPHSLEIALRIRERQAGWEFGAAQMEIRTSS
jgi:hypothetical protein